MTELRLNWTALSATEGILHCGDIHVHVCLPDVMDTKPSSPNDFVLLKTPLMVDEFVAMARVHGTSHMLELGVFRGGSVVAYGELIRPTKLVAVDLLPEGSPHLASYLARPAVRDRVSVHYGVNQADHARLAAICATEFQGAPLDLIVDDASHFLHETREAFRALFPRLRTGGLYVIEDWAWAHWPGAPWQDQRGGDYFHGKEPMSSFVVELMAMAGSSPAIDRLTVSSSTVVVVRGPGALQPGFDPARVWLNRGDALPRFRA